MIQSENLTPMVAVKCAVISSHLPSLLGGGVQINRITLLSQTCKSLVFKPRFPCICTSLESLETSRLCEAEKKQLLRHRWSTRALLVVPFNASGHDAWHKDPAIPSAPLPRSIDAARFHLRQLILRAIISGPIRCTFLDFSSLLKEASQEGDGGTNRNIPF